MIKNILWAVFAISVVLSVPTPATADEPDNETYRLLNLFGDVLERVRKDYVEPVTDKELIEAAIEGMLASLDPHSSYMNSDRYREMQVQTRGQFGGLGIQVTMQDGLIKVISPIDDTPAYRAGIKAGDLISHLDKEPVTGLTLNDAVEKMRGKVGTDIVLTVLRDKKEPFDVTLKRAVIKIKSVRSRVEGDVGYLRITQFTEQTLAGVEKELAALRSTLGDSMKGLVIDLRNNPGGLLDQAIEVSDAFLERGEIVSTRTRRPEETQRFNARAGDITNGLPIIVLINGGSASASEIVAGALQDHKRALILGAKSFGKGSVQTVVPLRQHGAMRLTTARYYTPSGRSIQAVGIEPDIEVDQARIEHVGNRTIRREADLKGALDRIGENGSGGEPAPSEENGDAPAQADGEKRIDYQLERALDLIHGISVFGAKVGGR
ncbi:MAG: S41 family peptidase [Rhodospirillales bacterium]|nr:S41 family peptidase [Rhodospirillales bacterium]MCW8861023.1 S41 family peptidase [Rhodospirillales bacterium]MCW8952880.1 S41 family peptidase [Rhodospirillales bacterium]MCW8970310.1 S41 family peptidase [Rhodospirillales bacterium]MCW9001992.1 S41 family peptidase [Rhodospirillales bacterium]